MKTLDEVKTLVGPLPTAGVPIMFLPVQIQTRFVTRDGQAQLLVRVYPDEVHLDNHQEGLTAAEVQWGRSYWKLIWPAVSDTQAQRSAWEQLAQRFGARRAAWVARRMTPANLDQRPGTPPAFPRPGPERSDLEFAPVLVRLLPDRWVVMGYRGGLRVVLEAGAPIPERLPVTLSPDDTPGPPVDAGELPVDEGMRWMVDFDAAVAVGMGVRIALPPGAAGSTLDTLLVFGVKGALDPATGTDRLEAMIDAQHYTRGLAFVPPGTPTNNTAEESSGYSRRDPDPDTSFRVEAHPPRLGAGSDGALAARLLGVRRELFAAVDGATLAEDQATRHMQTALWPVTGGYYLEQFLGSPPGRPQDPPQIFSSQQLDGARRFFIDFVRHQGPLPTLRVGRQPYGLVPVMSLDLVPESQSDEGRFLRALRLVREAWRSNLRKVPRLLPGEQDEDNLVEILRMQPVSVGYRARLAFQRHLFGSETELPDDLVADIRTHHTLLRERLVQLAGAGRWDDWRVLNVIPARAARRLADRLVQPGGEVPGVPLAPNYLSFLRTATFDDIVVERFPAALFPEGRPDVLLYLLLRHSVLLAQATIAYRILRRRGRVSGLLHFPEPTLIDTGTFGGGLTQTLLRALDLDPALRAQIHVMGAEQEPEAASLDELRTSLLRLEGLPVDSLARHLSGCLDLFSYRLDAWITALATRRLHDVRRQRPRGLVLGGFGWVERLQPAPRSPVPSPPPGEDGGPLSAATERGGYIHAPSMAHAATAAVLRSGYLADTGENGARPYAIDLRSHRVRLAQWLLDGVREGQPLGALLGYRFERSLHERGMDDYILPFRRIAPFGELDRARFELDDKIKELDRLEGLPHPGLVAARREVTLLRQRLRALERERDGLPGQLAAARPALSRTTDMLSSKEEEEAELEATRRQLQNAIDEGLAGTTLRPRLNETIAKLTQVRGDIGVLKDRQRRQQREVDRLEERQQTIDDEIDDTRLALQAAERDVRDLEILHHPGVANAREECETAQARFDALLQQYRQRYLFPPVSELGTLKTFAEVSVVDGLALLKLWQAREVPFEQIDPNLSATDQATLRAALQAELAVLEAAVDAMGDALTAEAVYQLVRGNPARAAASVDAVAHGEIPPPELQVAQTPRPGIPLTHRLVVLFSAPAAPPPAPGPRQARVAAEPALNAWLRQMLGVLEQVRFRAEFLVADEVVPVPGDLRLDRLGLTHLDLLYLTAGTRPGQPSDLERLLEYDLRRRAPARIPPDARVRLLRERIPGLAPTQLGLGEFLELLHAFRETILAARGVGGRDLAPAETDPPPGVDTVDLRARADRAVEVLAAARDRLAGARAAVVANADPQREEQVLDELRERLVDLVFLSCPDAVPGSARGRDAVDRARLLGQAQASLQEAARRSGQVADLRTGFDRAAASPEQHVRHDQERLRAVFGPAFLALPLVRPANGPELATAFRGSDDLQGGDPLQALSWLQGASRVRPGASRLLRALSYAAALERPAALELRVGQLPFKSGERWIALPDPPPGGYPPGKLSLVAHLPRPFRPDPPLAGLLVDEWVDVVPAPEVTTGVAFNYESPGARPPQSVLLAVTPPNAVRWELETIEKTLLETFELARLRALDPQALANDVLVHRALPAAYVSLNLAGDTLSTDFTTLE